jgi:hypothetical protein
MNTLDTIYVVCLSFENPNGDHETQRIKFFKSFDSAKQYIADRIAEIKNNPNNTIHEDYTSDMCISWEYLNEYGNVDYDYEDYEIETHPLYN